MKDTLSKIVQKENPRKASLFCGLKAESRSQPWEIARKKLLLWRHSNTHLNILLAKSIQPAQLVGTDDMNRDKTTIMADILSFCTRAAPKTRVMYKTNLTYKQMKTYLAFLASVGLIEHHSNEYMTTAKGHSFLRAYAALENLLDGGAA